MSARYNPRKEHSLKRSYGFRIPKKSFLIVCEGENTEPEYFNAFRLTSATIKAVGKGLGTMSLVKEAIAIRKAEKAKGKAFDYCWVVFDKDDYNDFDGAIAYAKDNGFNVAYSNQAFELWFLLHFNLCRGPLHRSKYAERLSRHLGEPYSKKAGYAKRLYQRIKPLEQTAIQNAETLLAEKTGVAPSMAESSTTVHELVKSLNEFID